MLTIAYVLLTFFSYVRKSKILRKKKNVRFNKKKKITKKILTFSYVFFLRKKK